MAGTAGEVPGRAGVHARVAALRGADAQRSVGEDAYVSAVQEGPPVFVPCDLRLGLPVSHALQADRLAQHRHVLHPGDAQHRRDWRGNRGNRHGVTWAQCLERDEWGYFRALQGAL